jgi:hypothetical protein
MFQARIHGRGGQGVVTAAELLPPRQTDPGYRRPPKDSLNWVPTPY